MGKSCTIQFSYCLLMYGYQHAQFIFQKKSVYFLAWCICSVLCRTYQNLVSVVCICSALSGLFVKDYIANYRCMFRIVSV